MRTKLRAGWIWAPAALVLLVVAPVGCGEDGVYTSSVTTSPDSGRGTKVFTLDELAGFDGKDGGPAYVAVDGVVYDVSRSPGWAGGLHAHCDLGATAGRDLSELIERAPANMRSLLSEMPVVGELAP